MDIVTMIGTSAERIAMPSFTGSVCSVGAGMGHSFASGHGIPANAASQAQHGPMLVGARLRRNAGVPTLDPKQRPSAPRRWDP